MTEKLQRLEAKRFGKTKNPRKNVEDAHTSPGSRSIAGTVKRVVCERDGDQCTYIASNGRRCTACEGLEFHHDNPYALGGDRSPENIGLLCRTHNVYMAELDYGKKKMDQYRGSADRIREPLPAFRLCLDGVAPTPHHGAQD